MKLICERTTFIPGFCVFSLHHNRSGVSPHPTDGRLRSATHRYTEWLTYPHQGKHQILQPWIVIL